MLILKDFVKKDKEIDLKALDEVIKIYIPSGQNIRKKDFEGRCFIVDFFFLSQYCENAVESQKKWLFLYQSCQSQYND